MTTPQYTPSAGLLKAVLRLPTQPHINRMGQVMLGIVNCAR